MIILLCVIISFLIMITFVLRGIEDKIDAIESVLNNHLTVPVDNMNSIDEGIEVIFGDSDKTYKIKNEI